jgi:hypothetical protein
MSSMDTPEAAQIFYHLAVGTSAALGVVVTIWFTFFKKSKSGKE